MENLSAIQLRVLGCLIEKKETTPEQYPLTLNALRNACNQKSSRDPVTNYQEGEVTRAVRDLEELGWVREQWGARVPRYEHRAGKVLGIYRKGLAILAVLMLRGPQTSGELKSHTRRLHPFEDVEDVLYALEDLQNREPPLVTALPRQPGQKEGRFMQLLGGEPEAPGPRTASRQSESDPPDGIEARVSALEAEVAALRDRLAEFAKQFEEGASNES